MRDKLKHIKFTNSDRQIEFVINEADQAKELTRLEKWIKRVANRPRRQGLCIALKALIDRGAIGYVLCRSRTGNRKGFGIIAKQSEIQDVIDSAYAYDVVSALLIKPLLDPIALFETGYSAGQPDLIFQSLIYEKDEKGSRSRQSACSPRTPNRS